MAGRGQLVQMAPVPGAGAAGGAGGLGQPQGPAGVGGGVAAVQQGGGALAPAPGAALGVGHNGGLGQPQGPAGVGGGVAAVQQGGGALAPAPGAALGVGHNGGVGHPPVPPVGENGAGDRPRRGDNLRLGDNSEVARAQQNLSLICVVAALLATLAYSGVLTPPKELSECQDLCQSSLLRLSVVTLESQLFVNQLADQVRYKTVDDLITYAVSNIVYKVIEQQQKPDFDVKYAKSVAAALQVFCVANGVALFSSMCCLVIAGCRSIPAQTAEQYGAIADDCLKLLMVASVSVFVAFLVAHIQVYKLGEGPSGGWSVGLGILLVCALAFVIVACVKCRAELQSCLRKLKKECATNRRTIRLALKQARTPVFTRLLQNLYDMNAPPTASSVPCLSLLYLSIMTCGSCLLHEDLCHGFCSAARTDGPVSGGRAHDTRQATLEHTAEFACS